ARASLRGGGAKSGRSRVDRGPGAPRRRRGGAPSGRRVRDTRRPRRGLRAPPVEGLKRAAHHDGDETRVTKLTHAAPHAVPQESCLVVIYGPDLGKRIRLERAE